MQRKFPVIIIILVVLVGFIFWRVNRSEDQSPASVEEDVVEEVVATAVPTAAPNQPETEQHKGLEQIYYNSEGDFSLLLPADWVVGQATATPLGNQYPLGPGTPEGSRILIAEASTTQEEALTQVMCEGCEVKSEKEIILQNSQIPVQRVNLRAANMIREEEWFFIEQGDKLIVLSINNPKTKESLEAIIHSFAPGQLTDIGIESLVAVQASRDHLAGQFGLDPYNVIVESLESAEWENTCIGAELPSHLCENIPTKGYIMDLRIGGQVFTYHANEAGTRAVPEVSLSY